VNPLAWKREHQLALGLAGLIGIGLGIVLGYLVYATGWGSDSVSFGYWLNKPMWSGALWWGLFGGVIGAVVIYMIRLMRM